MGPTIVLGWEGSYYASSDCVAWVNYVRTHIDEACGFDVAVEVDGRTTSDRITAVDDDRRAHIKKAVRTLWDKAIRINFGLPMTEVL